MLTILAFPVLAGLITFFLPVYGLGLFGLTLIIHGLLVSWLGSAAQHIPLFIGAAVAIILLLKGHLQIRVSNGAIALLGLFIVMCLSALMSDNHQLSMIVLLLYTKGFLLSVLVTFAVDDERGLNILSVFLLLGVFIGAAATMYQYVTGSFTINFSYLQRAASLREDPNDTAMLLATGIPLAAFWILHAKSRSVRIINMVVFACILGGIVLTKSRGGFITTVLVVGILYFKNLSLKTTIGIIIVLSGFFIFGSVTGYWDRVETLSTWEEEGSSLDGRLDLLKKGTDLFLQNILIGVGPGNFEENYLKSRTETCLGGPRIKGAVAHNLFLEHAVENGIFGIALLLAVFYCSLRGFVSLAQGDPNNPFTGIAPYLGISLIALLISGLFLSQAKNSVLWFIVGLGFAAEQIKRYSTSKHPGTDLPKPIIS